MLSNFSLSQIHKLAIVYRFAGVSACVAPAPRVLAVGNLLALDYIQPTLARHVDKQAGKR